MSSALQRAEPLQGHQFAVHTGNRRRADLEVKVRPLPLDQGAQGFVDVEHPALYRPGGRMT